MWVARRDPVRAGGSIRVGPPPSLRLEGGPDVPHAPAREASGPDATDRNMAGMARRGWARRPSNRCPAARSVSSPSTARLHDVVGMLWRRRSIRRARYGDQTTAQDRKDRAVRSVFTRLTL